MIRNPDNVPGIGGEGSQESTSYALTRRGFLDVAWNRIESVVFRPMRHIGGEVFPLPGTRDQFGRVKVCLVLDINHSPEQQAQTLVHESVHIDRASWARNPHPSWTDAFIEEYAKEDTLTENAANIFFEAHKPLALKVLNHLKLRGEYLKD